MTPEEKAEELYLKYKEALNIRNDMRPGKNPFAKECAIICLEQIILAAKQFDIDLDKYHGQSMFPELYWEEVLEHIKNS